MKKSLVRYVGAVACLGLGISPSFAQVSPVVNTVALFADPIPNTSTVMVGLGIPAIDDAGDVLFNATTNFGGTFPVQTKDLTGQGLIGAPSALPGFTDNLGDPCFLFFSDQPVTNEGGTLAVHAGVGNRRGCPGGAILKGPSLPDLQLFLRADELPLPGLTPVAIPQIDPIVINEAGTIAFLSKPFGAESGLRGVFVALSPNEPLIVALEGEQAPDIPTGGLFASFTNLVINKLGEIAFVATLQQGTGDVTFLNDTGVWYFSGGTLSLVARKGDIAPETSSLPFKGFLDIAISPGQEVAFLGRLSNSFTPSGLWRGTSTTDVTLVAGGSQPTPTTDGFSQTFFGISVPTYTSTGDLVFQASSTVVEDGIWRDTGVGPVERVVGGNGFPVGSPPLPGDPAGDTGGTFFAFGDFAVNGAGRIAFFANYTGSGLSVATSLWAQDSAGNFVLLVQPGDILETRDSPRTVNALSLLAGQGNESGLGTGFSNRNEVAFFAQFTDGTTGVFRRVVGDAPPLGNQFVWSGDVGDNDWHSTAGGESNWNDLRGDTIRPPGLQTSDVATIALDPASSGVFLGARSASIASIAATGGLTVSQPLTLDAPSTIDSLTIDAGQSLEPQTGDPLITAIDLTLTGNSAWTRGDISATGGMVVNRGMMTIDRSAASIPSGSPKELRGRYVNDAMATTVQFHTINLNNATIENRADATWKIVDGDITDSGAVGVIDNMGTLVKPDDPFVSTSIVEAFLEARADSRLEVRAKKLTLTGGATFTSPTSIVVGGLSEMDASELVLKGGALERVYQIPSGTTTMGRSADTVIRGIVRVDPGAAVSVVGDSILAVEDVELNLNGGKIVGTGAIVVGTPGATGKQGKLMWGSGTIGQPALGVPGPTVLIHRNADLIIEGSPKVVTGTLTVKTREGFARVRSDLTLQGGDLVIDRGTVLVDTRFAGNPIVFAAAGAEQVIINGVLQNSGFVDGTLTVQAISGVTVSAAIDNEGSVLVLAGPLHLTGPIAQVAGATLTAGQWQAGTINNTTPAILDMPGRFITTIGAKASVIISGNGSLPQMELGHVVGELIIEDGGTYTTPVALTNDGRITIAGSFPLVDNLVINGAGLRNNGEIVMFRMGVIQVGGSYFTSEGSKTSILRGTLTALLVTVNGGKFEGSGTINAQTFDNNGKLRAGGSSPTVPPLDAAYAVGGPSTAVGTPAGVMTINADYVQGPTASFEVGLGGLIPGAEHDQLVINGNAALAGTLRVLPMKGFLPQVGQAYTIMSVTGGTITGTFDQVVAPGAYSVNYGPNSVTVTVTTVPGDSTGDNAISLADYSDMATCISGPGNAAALGCDTFDFDANQAVDLRDWCTFQTIFGLPTP